MTSTIPLRNHIPEYQTSTMGGAKGEEAKEHLEHANGKASGSNSPQSLYLGEPKLRKVPHDGPNQPHVLAEHGPLVDHKNMPLQEAEVPYNPDLWWSRVRAYCQEGFSEFFGVFIMILFGDGVVAQVVLSGNKNGQYQSITWGE
jgi:hypothetical protein